MNSFFKAIAAALLFLPNISTAQSMEPKALLAGYDCKQHDLAACEAVISLDYWTAFTIGDTAKIKTLVAEVAAAKRKGCSGGSQADCADLGYILYRKGETQNPEVYRLLTGSCDAGIGRACATLSDLNYYLAEDVSKDYLAYYEDLTTHCKAGDVGACTSQSRLNVLLPWTPPDRAIWYDQMQAACDADNARACVIISYMLSDDGLEEYERFDPNWGRKVRRGLRHAHQAAVKGCDLGNPVGCYNAGLDLDYGDGVRRNLQTAHQYYAQACSGGYPNGCYEINYHSYWVERDRLADLEKACKIGDFTACYYATAKRTPPRVIPPKTDADQALLVSYLKELAAICEMGSALACGDAAVIARSIKQLDQAERFANVACILQQPNGCSVMGNILKLDRGTPADLKKAILFHTMACDEGSRVGCNNLGDTYEKGLGAEKDVDRAATLYSIACTKKLSLGCRNLGQLYDEHAPEKAANAWQQACRLNPRYCN